MSQGYDCHVKTRSVYLFFIHRALQSAACGTARETVSTLGTSCQKRVSGKLCFTTEIWSWNCLCNFERMFNSRIICYCSGGSGCVTNCSHRRHNSGSIVADLLEAASVGNVTRSSCRSRAPRESVGCRCTFLLEVSHLSVIRGVLDCVCFTHRPSALLEILNPALCALVPLVDLCSLFSRFHAGFGFEGSFVNGGIRQQAVAPITIVSAKSRLHSYRSKAARPLAGTKSTEISW